MTPQERTTIAELSEREKELRVRKHETRRIADEAEREWIASVDALEDENNRAMGLAMESVH